MPQYLHHNDFGCLSRCPNGCCLHLYFGNVALCLKPAELEVWRTDLTMLYRLHAPHVADAHTRCLTLPGSGPYQAFVFTLEEVFLLQDLLTGAALLLEAESILAAALNNEKSTG
jgi:hypothetical protein